MGLCSVLAGFLVSYLPRAQYMKRNILKSCLCNIHKKGRLQYSVWVPMPGNPRYSYYNAKIAREFKN